MDTCVQTLNFCAQVDHTAREFESRVCRYVQAVRVAVEGELNADSSEIVDDDASVDYLFITPAGNTDLHRAARDLLHLVQKPFSTALELPSPSPDHSTRPQLGETLVNWAEAAVGSSQEWTWELRQCGSPKDAETVNTDNSLQILDVMSKSSPSRFLSRDEKRVWTTATPQAF